MIGRINTLCGGPTCKTIIFNNAESNNQSVLNQFQWDVSSKASITTPQSDASALFFPVTTILMVCDPFESPETE